MFRVIKKAEGCSLNIRCLGLLTNLVQLLQHNELYVFHDVCNGLDMLYNYDCVLNEEGKLNAKKK